MSDNKAALAAAMAGGYLLGRTKKAKLALVVGSYLTGRRLGVSPAQVLSRSLGRLQEAPQFRELTDQVRGELFTAGRAAVTAATDRSLSRFADALRDRTDALGATDSRDGAQPEDADTDTDADENPDENMDQNVDEFDDDEFEDEDEDGPPPRRAAKKAPGHRPPPVRTTARKTAAPARRRVPGGGRG
ncbi:hypothetical protein AB0E75_04985 [Streptomyces griseoviridis]|jgi:hypothetical protein|nr:hypothetical protein [Streptomyces niveoruber]